MNDSARDDPGENQFSAAGILFAAAKVVELIEKLDPPNEKDFKAWLKAWRGGSPSDWIGSARTAGVDPRPGLVTLWLRQTISNWYDGAWQALDWVEAFHELEVEEDGSPADALLRQLLKALNDAGRIENLGGPSESYDGSALLRLIEMLIANDHPDVALAVADGTSQLPASASLRVPSLRLAASAAFLADKPGAAALRLGLLATQPGLDSLERFDAMETCLRWAGQDEHAPLVIATMRPWLESEFLALGFFGAGWVATNDPAAATPESLTAAKIRPVLVQGGLDEWLWAADQMLSALGSVERVRLALMGPLPDRPLTADWGTFSFQLRAFERCVPIGDSLRHMREADDIALLVHHETTHVLSMMGALGWALLAMRAAILECELYLMAGAEQERQRLDPLGFDEKVPPEGLGPLGRHSPATLIDVERQLDLLRKTQIITELWQPWFEGIAVVSELCDDATEGNIFSPSASILYNLFDRGAFEPANQPARSDPEGLLAHMKAVDGFYRDAVEHWGRYRLRNYLNEPHHRMHYLPGYLGVRRVVAAWRNAVEAVGTDTLDGAAIARLLLHVTRFASEETVPAPDLPFDEFERAAREKFTEWLASLTTLAAPDLTMAAAAYRHSSDDNTGMKWVSGKLVIDTLGTSNTELDTFNRIATAAARSMIETNNDPSRVANADIDCRHVMKLVSDLAREHRQGEPEWRDQLWQEVMHPFSILEIAEAECPFWLLVDQPAIGVLLRTSEHDIRAKGAVHQMLSYPLEAGRADELAAEVRRLGSGRLRARRVADLSDRFIGDDGGQGRQYLVLDYGSWQITIPVGLQLGASEVGPELAGQIRQRLAPSNLSRLDQSELGAGRAPAERARAWINQAADWDVGEGMSAAAWALHVRGLADDILAEDERGTAAWASRHLLEFALGDAARAELVADQGLQALLPADDPAALSAFFSFLDATSRKPVEILPAELSALDGVVKRRRGWDFDPGTAKRGSEA